MNVVQPAPVAQPAAHADQVQALAQACHALWSATLSLMVAFMQTSAPAHRYLLARRIARNYETLLREGDCFTPAARASFKTLAGRWADKAARLSPQQEGRPTGGLGVLARLFAPSR